MKILLTAINAKYIHSNLALYSLKAYAKPYEKWVELQEFTINQTKDTILKGIFRRKPEVLCVSCYIWNISYIKELTGEIHKILPDTAIWLGGPEVSYTAAEILRACPQITGIMRGEGEGTFLDLVKYYVDGRGSLEEILGITWRERVKSPDEQSTGDRIRENPWRPVLSMDALPFIYEDMRPFQNRIIYYESSRGCPFSCSYCMSSLDKKVRFRSLELVKRELQFFLDQKVPQVKFVDRTFNCDHRHAMEIWMYIMEHDNGITNFHFEIEADLLRPEELELIGRFRPGMVQMEIGIQSTHPQTIREIRRRSEFARVKKAVMEIQKNHNVHQHLDLIVGLPYEDYETFTQSFNDVYALRPQQFQMGFLKLLKGSYMAQKAADYGCVCQEQEPYEILYNRWISYEDVLRFKQVEEVLEVYYNSNQFLKTLPAAERLFATPFAFYQSLGAYYEEKGYFDISHTRIRRYEILLEFLEERDPKGMDLYRELMIYDLYARENMKSRPGWASDLSVYRKKSRRFYRQEAECPHYLSGYEGYEEKQLSRMTHIEVLRYDPDSWEPGEWVLLFDYRKRDPLTDAAYVQKIRKEDWDGE